MAIQDFVAARPDANGNLTAAQVNIAWRDRYGADAPANILNDYVGKAGGNGTAFYERVAKGDFGAEIFGVDSYGNPKAPTFKFDWEKSRQDALTQLTPYYEQKLKEAGGDVGRAKRLIEEDYTRGVRYSKEDLTRTTMQGEEDAATAFKTLGLDVAEENRNLRGSLNQKGILLGTIPQGDISSAAPVSEYAKAWHINPQEERQGLRKLAIERALKRQKEASGTTATRDQENLTAQRARGIEEQDIGYPRTQRDLEEEKRRRAFETVAPMKYSEEYAKYKALNNLG